MNELDQTALALKYGRVELSASWVHSLPADISGMIEQEIRHFGEVHVNLGLSNSRIFTLGYTLTLINDKCSISVKENLVDRIQQLLEMYEKSR